MKGKILILDDERDMLALLKRIISEETPHAVTTETDPLQAIQQFEKTHFDMVITDLKMPKIDGIRLLEELKKRRPKVSVIIMTAYATIETAVEAIQKGAYDYITKPFRRERILLTVDKVMKWQEMIAENLALRQALAEKGDPFAFIGASPPIKEIFQRIRQVAPTLGTVLITGASGTGKELIAKAIHRNSPRSANKLVTINCTAIPEEVIESELFGHVKGAFTGAWKDKTGLVEEAHEGTLFLDEIGDLSPRLQTKLLRLLQAGEYKPVGSVTTKTADLRFIAATNHNLKADVQEKRFREDLYYRLNVIHFELPPLKDRKQDIPLLSLHFLKRYARINQKDIRAIAPRAMQALMACDFPGNVRELENIIERGVIFCDTDTLEMEDLLLESESPAFFIQEKPDIYKLPFKEAKDMMTDLFHMQYIRRLLTESGGNISKAAEIAGIQRQYLHRLLKDTGLDALNFKTKATPYQTI